MGILGALGDLVLSLSADTAKFQSDLGRAQRVSDKFAREVGRSLGNLAGALVALGGAAGFGALVKGQINAADQASKTAQKIGLSVEALSQYQVAAKFADVSNQQLQVGLQQLAKNQADFVIGTGEAMQAFHALGISEKQVKDLHGDTAKLFDLIVGKLSKFEDGANKTAIAMRIFGRSGSELIPLINSMDELSGKARELGLIIDSETAAAADRFNDNMDSIGMSVQAVGLNIAKVLLPSLDGMSMRMAEAAKNTEALERAGRTADAGLKLLASGAVVIATLFDTAGKRIGGVIAAIVSAAKGNFSEAFTILKETATDSLTGLADGLKRIDEIWNSFGGPGGTVQESGDRLNEFWKSINKQGAPGLRNLAAEAKEAEKQFKLMADAINRAHEDAMNWATSGQQIENSDTEGRLKMFGQVEDFEGRNSERLEALRQTLLTEEEIEVEAHSRRLEQLEALTEEELSLLGGKHSALEQLERQHQNRMIEIDMRKHQAVRSMEVGTFQLASGLLQKFAGESKTAAIAIIAIEKGLAIAQIQMNTAVAVMRAFAELGPIAGAAAAAKIKALGAIQTGLVLATGFIEAAQVSGGGGTTSVDLPPSQGVTVAPTGTIGTPLDASVSRQTTVVHLHGETFSKKQLRDLFDLLNEGGRDGQKFVLA